MAPEFWLQIKQLNLQATGPRRMTEGSAGYDIFACLPNHSVTIQSGTTAIIPTGFAMAFPPGFEAQIRPRSGLAAKHGVTVLNTPGTIDSDYRGEVKVILINHHPVTPYTVRHGERIAQMVFSRYYASQYQVVDTLASTDRGSGGFGSTGK